VDARLNRKETFRSALRWFRIAAMVAILVPSFSGIARAHAPLLSRSEFEWQEPATVRASLVFSWQDAVLLARLARSGADAGSDGFARVVTTGIQVSADGEPCPGNLEEAGPYEGDGFLFLSSFHCAHRPKTLRVGLPLLRMLPSEHRHLVRLFAGAAVVQAMLGGSHERVELVLPPPEVGPSTPAAAPFGASVRDAVILGVRHILMGWDHVLFLLGIAFGVRRFRAVVLPISAFTLAHSITLAIASLGVFSLSPRIVEPAIAASIAYVAFENVIRPAPSHRSLVTFFFGLLHGFGFAGALTELALDRERLVPTLLGFNLGVEAGQLSVLVVALPLILWIRSKAGGRIARATCIAIGIVGAGLCIARVIHAVGRMANSETTTEAAETV
jgi:HupE / UreJ protein